MKIKTKHTGHCLYCGKESKTPFCNRQCYVDYVRIGVSSDPQQAAKEREKRRRDSLPDSMIRKYIYIASKGKIKYADMTAAMIIEKRTAIQDHRYRKENDRVKAKKSKRKGPFQCKCSVCGIDFISNHSSSNKCSDICSRKQALERLREKYKNTWQPPPSFICKECGKTYQPEYGDTRTTFCSDRCSHKHARREHKKRAEENGVFYEYVNPRKVFERDGWRCQLCKKKLRPKDRGATSDNAPELDHIIPWAKGGEHSYRNTQCVCRKCNSVKGAMIQGQLRMFA